MKNEKTRWFEEARDRVCEMDANDFDRGVCIPLACRRDEMLFTIESAIEAGVSLANQGDLAHAAKVMGEAVYMGWQLGFNEGAE